MKILLSAYACEPGKGSEPAVGWNAAIGLASQHEVWVITRSNNQQAITAELAKNPIPNLHFVYFDLPFWMRWWKRGQIGVQLYYYLWQIGIFFLASRLHKRVVFNLIHHVTFVNYYKPSFLAFLPVPFVWGPVGGGESSPRSFWRSWDLDGRVYEFARELVRWLGERDPFVRSSAYRSRVALATTHETAARLSNLGAHNVAVLSQVTLNEQDINYLSSLPIRENGTLRFLSMGNLLPFKGFHLGIEAFAKANLKEAEYWIIGNGPERARLEQLVGKLGIANRVRFLGALPRAQALAQLAECDVLIHPSLHDSGGFVCVEAMASGKPVICLDIGGPALLVSDEAGTKVPADTPSMAVGKIAQAMRAYKEDKNKKLTASYAARARALAQFSSSVQIQEILAIYRSLENDTP